MKYLNQIQFITLIIEQDKAENATYQIDENFNIDKLTKSDLMERGRYILGIGAESDKIDYFFHFEQNLGKNKIYVGKWKDPQTNKILIEIVEFRDKIEDATRDARKHKQYAIYGILEERDIILIYE